MIKSIHVLCFYFCDAYRNILIRKNYTKVVSHRLELRSIFTKKIMICTKLLNIPDNQIIGHVNDAGNITTNYYYTKGERVTIYLKRPGAGISHICSATGDAGVCYPIVIDYLPTPIPACSALPSGRIDLYDSSCMLIVRNAIIDSIICNEPVIALHIAYWTT